MSIKLDKNSNVSPTLNNNDVETQNDKINAEDIDNSQLNNEDEEGQDQLIQEEKPKRKYFQNKKLNILIGVLGAILLLMIAAIIIINIFF